MSRRRRHFVAGNFPPAARIGALAAVFPLLLVGCASKEQKEQVGESSEARTVEVTVTTEGCRPEPAKVSAGLVRFHVTNQGAAAVNEVELLAGKRILGEKENLAPGLSGEFTLRLEPGTYTLYCPNAETQRTDFTVTGTTAASSSAGAAEATTTYHDYVVAEARELLEETERFADSVRRGDVAAARELYGEARWHYEAIEPVAESFGDLDPAIDARADDVADPAQWTGFHRIEKALWADGSLAGMTPVADRLVADVRRLVDLITTQRYQPAQIANGAVELLDEIGRTKVTGEEERYSHTDLVDIDANLNGAKEAYEAIRPLLVRKNADLAQTIDQRFESALAALAPYARGESWVAYTEVDTAGRRAIAQHVDAVAEPLSQVAALVG
ncbi:MAG: cupredoxin domain-containing protein [Acidothermus sp.]|nr:cupredoxin domain-containing protein [Acidothermus sp.]MCL6537727.1 cupredoxin domain-containing protein [Acidothermus sp.]